MIKKLTRYGSGYAIVINKPIMELLGASATSEFEMRVEGKSLIITPKERVPSELRDAKLQKLVKKNIKKYASDLKKLAKN